MKTCSDFVNLIQLNRSGERTGKEEKRLARHLSGCAGCRKLQDQMDQAGQQLRTFAAARPELEDGPEFTGLIMGRIPADPNIFKKGLRVKSTLFPLPMPRYQLLLTSLALGIIVLILVQGFTFFNRLSLLEKKIAAQTDPTYQTRSHLLNPMGTEVLNQIAAGDQPFWQELSGDRIIISRKTMLQLFDFYRELNAADTSLPPILEKRAEMFRKMILGFPVDRADFMEMLRHKDEIVRFLLDL